MINTTARQAFFIPILLIGISVSWISCDSNEGSSNPNIIIVFTDDQGYGDLGSYGAVGFQTPNIDKLAEEGVRFTNFYVAATVCTPSRAGLLTGLYPKRVGLHKAVLYPFSSHGLEQQYLTLAEALKSKGYQTYCIGKWHLGHLDKYMPKNHGFDYFYGVPYSNDMDGHYYKHNDFQSPPLPFYSNDSIIAKGVDQQFLTQMYTSEAVEQIRKRDAEIPFFMYVAHSMPHVPLHVTDAFKNKSELGLYGDVIMELDWSVGQIRKALTEEGILNNTLFIFTSDNGPQIGSSGALRGRKAQTWEGGQRVPAIISWPDSITGGSVSNEVVSTLDLFPTILANTKGSIEQHNNYNFDGRDISAHLFDPGLGLPDSPFFYYNRNGQPEAVRLGKWKLHIAKELGWNKEMYGTFKTALYNLDTDIGEQINLAEKHPEIVIKLSEIIRNFDQSLNQD